MKITIIEDGSSNALLYERHKFVRGDHVFGSYIKKFYELKNKPKKIIIQYCILFVKTF
jgi:hypothetical protein